MKRPESCGTCAEDDPQPFSQAGSADVPARGVATEDPVAVRVRRGEVIVGRRGQLTPGSSSSISWVIVGATARSLSKAVTWRCLIQVTPLLDRFIAFSAVATGTSSAAITPVPGLVSSCSTSAASSHDQHRLAR